MRKANLNGQLSRFPGTPVRTADQHVHLQIQFPQLTNHVQSPSPAKIRQRTLRMITA